LAVPFVGGAINRITIIIAAVLALFAAAAWFAWTQRGMVETPPPVATTAPAVPPSAPSATPEVQHPVAAPPQEASAAVAPLPTLATSDATVRAALLDWLGKDQVQAFLQLDDFIRHVVATVDNLGRSHAAPRLWPVNPMPGRFEVVQTGDVLVAAPGNAERYGAFVKFVEGADLDQGVALYRRAYPLFQKAYEELGYPGRYFNDRLVEVIDLLLATPVPAQPPQLKLTEVKGPIASTRPWVRYEFADASLESLSAGQKMLLRTGPAHQQRLQARLLELRNRIARAPAR
jgi:hypothetical protein